MRVSTVLGMAGLSLLVVDCLDTRSDEPYVDAGVTQGAGGEPPIGAGVSVDLSLERAVVAPHAFGMHASVYDNRLHDPALPELLREAGITLLRYPGGGYSDNYHWSTHTMTPWPNGNPGYLGPGSDFGSFVGVVERFDGALMITVNYGSNLQGTGGGEPKEAAAWVAYANGDPDDPHTLGEDGVGNDWRTVGYWASLRASEPLAEDDGKNFLRIAHPEPLGIEYWEIGNEVFGNGYNERGNGQGFELDLHEPYVDGGVRRDAEALSGTTYGRNVLEYIAEMKAVDPTIKIGAALGTPPADYAWGARRWNDQVLSECGAELDFAVVHWYPNVQVPNRANALLAYPRNAIPVMVQELRASFEQHAGDNAPNIELTMTEVGPGATPENQGFVATEIQAIALFALDTYVTLMEHGFQNIDWLELHNGSFLAERSDAKGPAFHGIRMAHLLASAGDRLVTAESERPTLVVHASRRGDGRTGVLLVNTDPPGTLATAATVELTGASVAMRGERWDFFPTRAGTLGSVSGPEPFSELESPFTVTVPPWGASLLLFDAAD